MGAKSSKSIFLARCNRHTFSHPPGKVVILATSQAGMYNTRDQGGGLPALDPGYHGLVNGLARGQDGKGPAIDRDRLLARPLVSGRARPLTRPLASGHSSGRARHLASGLARGQVSRGLTKEFFLIGYNIPNWVFQIPNL